MLKQAAKYSYLGQGLAEWRGCSDLRRTADKGRK